MARRPRPRLRPLSRPNDDQLRHSRLSRAQPRQEDSMGTTRHSHRRGATTLQDRDAEQPASALQMEVTSRRWTTTSEELDTARTNARHAEEESFRSNPLDRTHLVDAHPSSPSPVHFHHCHTITRHILYIIHHHKTPYHHCLDLPSSTHTIHIQKAVSYLWGQVKEGWHVF